MKRGVMIFWSVILAVILLSVGAIVFLESKPGKLGPFAQCLDESGAVFYGAFWCSHCAATKAMFGASAKLLPYVECSTPDRKGQLPICTEKGIMAYPTWIFANGTTLTGELTLQQLSEQTACPLPQ